MHIPGRYPFEWTVEAEAAAHGRLDVDADEVVSLRILANDDDSRRADADDIAKVRRKSSFFVTTSFCNMLLNPKPRRRRSS